MTVKILNGRLTEQDIEDRGKQTVLEGQLDLTTIDDILVDKYQREERPSAGLYPIVKALVAGETLPQIDLGMRGTRVDIKGDTYILRDPVYIIDGQQRLAALRRFLATNPTAYAHVSAMVHLDTEEPWERVRFQNLNANKKNVSANVILKNCAPENRAVVQLLALCTNDVEFPLYKRVSWGQNMGRDNLMPGLTLARVAGALHSHIAPASHIKGNPALAKALARIADDVGLMQFRYNIKNFFIAVDRAYGLKAVQYRTAAPQLRQTFLIVLAAIFSDHVDFWKQRADTELFIPADQRRKLGTFPLADPHIQNLCGGGGGSRRILYGLIRDHLNKSRSKNRLVERTVDTPLGDADGGESEFKLEAAE